MKVTFKRIVEELVKQELQTLLTETVYTTAIKWTDSDNMFKSFEGRYRSCEGIGDDRKFIGFVNEVGTIDITLM